MRVQPIKAIVVTIAMLFAGSAFAAATPIVTAVTPNAGKTAAGATVTITGVIGFTGATAVTFNGVAATAVVVNSDTSITCNAPAGAAGLQATVAVTAPGGVGSLTLAYTYQAAGAFTSVSPTSGPAGGGNFVTITGTGFNNTSGAAGVLFGAVNATSYTVVSNTTIIAKAPGGAGGVTITVAAPGGSVTSPLNAYTYNAVAAPTVTSITPSSGAKAENNTVIITGTNFNNGNVSSVTFGAAGAGTVTIIDGQTLSVVTPTSAATGMVTVTVTNATGSATTNYTYTSTVAPNLQVNVKVTIASRADIQWGNATTPDDVAVAHALTITPYTWILKDAEYGVANQINIGGVYGTNDSYNPHALTISNVSPTNAQISITGQCTGAESNSSGIAWTASAAGMDTFGLTATLGNTVTVGPVVISPGPTAINPVAANYILKGIDQNLVLSFSAPTAISNPLTTGVQQTVTVTLIATAH